MTTDSRYQSGTVQGNAAGIPQDTASDLNAFAGVFGAFTEDGHKGTMAGQLIFPEEKSYYESGTTHEGLDGLIQKDKTNLPSDCSVSCFGKTFTGGPQQGNDVCSTNGCGSVHSYVGLDSFGCTDNVNGWGGNCCDRNNCADPTTD
jgi:hypothetical protein